MKSRHTAALFAAAALTLGLAACGGSGDSSSSESSSATTPAAEAPKPVAGNLTPPGAQLKVGQDATIAWVPFAEDDATGTGAKKGIELKASVVSIEKKTTDDLSGIELEPEEEEKTPYFVKVRIEALGDKEPPENEEPDIRFAAIDDRDQEAGSLTLLGGSFEDCENEVMPRPFTSGESFESCLIYLVHSGGSIEKVQWADGPAGAEEITPYFDEPIVWEGS